MTPPGTWPPPTSLPTRVAAAAALGAGAAVTFAIGRSRLSLKGPLRRHGPELYWLPKEFWECLVETDKVVGHRAHPQWLWNVREIH